MQTQQKLLVDHFQKLGGTVELQQFRVRHPLDGSAVPMANLIVALAPGSQGAHPALCPLRHASLSRSRSQQSARHVHRRQRRRQRNGGADGTGPSDADLPGRLGVDFVLFDGEELVFREGDLYFLGSEYFAQDYVANPPPYRYRWGVLLDMVGDADLQIYQERGSAGWRDTKPLVKAIWDTAKRLGVREFIPQKGHEVRDDHLPLHNTAKIPTCDIIDFDYPSWHTAGDTADQCSALSLAKVGWVIGEWVRILPEARSGLPEARRCHRYQTDGWIVTAGGKKTRCIRFPTVWRLGRWPCTWCCWA